MQKIIIDSLSIAPSVEHLQGIWLVVGLFFLLIIMLFIFDGIKRDYFIEKLPDLQISKPSFLANEWIFKLLILAMFFILRLPGLARGETNIDEGLWITGALTLAKDPWFWQSFDGTTSGPLVVYPLLLIKLLGLDINYVTVKVFSIILSAINLLFLYEIFKTYFSKSLAKVLIFPTLACISTIWSSELISYQSEHIPSFMLMLVLWIYTKYYHKKNQISIKNNRFILILIGVILGCFPFTKLQIVPVGLTLGGFFVFETFQKHKLLSCYLVIAALLPAIFAFSSLFLSGGYQDFWLRFIVTNLAYSEGTFFGNIFKLQSFIGGLPDIRFYFLIYWHMIFLSLIIIIPFKILEVRNIILCSILLLSTLYSCMAPGKFFLHYLFFLIFPLSYTFGIFAGTVFEKQILNQSNIAIELKKLLITSFIFFIGIIPFYFNLINLNPVFQIAKNDYSRKTLSENRYTSTIINHIKSPNDRIVVWGWAGNYFAETQLASGVRDSHIYYLALPPQKAGFADYYKTTYLEDLKKSKPLAIVDAVSPSHFLFADSTQMRLATFPSIEGYIKTNYEVVNISLGVKLFIRNDRVKEVSKLIKYTPNAVLDNIFYISDTLNLQGYGILKHLDSKYVKYKLFLIKHKKVIPLNYENELRQDVSGNNPFGFYDYSGFRVKILKKDLEVGEYQLKIQFYSQFINKPKIFLIDKKVIVQN